MGFSFWTGTEISPGIHSGVPAKNFWDYSLESQTNRWHFKMVLWKNVPVSKKHCLFLTAHQSILWLCLSIIRMHPRSKTIFSTFSKIISTPLTRSVIILIYITSITLPKSFHKTEKALKHETVLKSRSKESIETLCAFPRH